MEDNTIQIFVRPLSGKEIGIRVNPENSVEEIKIKMKENGESNLENSKVTFRGKELKDDAKISDCQIKDKSKLMIINKKPASSSTTTTTTTTTPIKKEIPLERKLCEGGCGFWGDPLNDNLCSQCFKKRKEEKEKSEIEKKRKIEEELRIKEELANKIEVKQTDFTRCWSCNRKIGLVGFTCDCGYNFCGKHRMAEQHSCPIDYKKKDRKVLLDKQFGDYENSKFR